MILRGIEWKARSLNAEDELSSRKKITETNYDEHNDDILTRPWF